jgi:Calcineurin-like phosphoesterase
MDSVLVGQSPSASSRVIVVPDPQYAVAAETSIFHDQISWIIARAPTLVVFVGDLNDGGGIYWTNWPCVQLEFGRLTAAGIPWMVSLGNHDYLPLADRTTSVNSYLSIPPGVTPWLAGHLENSYRTISLSGRTWLVLCLEWSPRTAVVAWANSVAALYPTVPVLLVTHCYLYRDGTRYNWAVYGDAQESSPHSAFYSLITTPAEGINDGEELWTGLVRDNENIRLVMCGHCVAPTPYFPQTTFATETRLSGTKCHQLRNDYQSEAPFGGGWLVEYTFDEVNHSLYARTYSPYWGTEKTFDANNFYLPMP